MRKSLRAVEIAAWIFGLLCSSLLLASRLQARAAQKASASIGQGPPPASIPGPNSPSQIPSASASPDEGRTARSTAGTDQLLGRLEIPELHLSTPILDNDDTQSLLLGAGHIRGTAMPGGLGNFVIAAHRDTYFRPLAGIKPGMTLRVVTPEETFLYLVDSTKIVLPDDVDVLDIGDVPEMTLITCYPFHYIGAAPKRFIVRAHLAGF